MKKILSLTSLVILFSSGCATKKVKMLPAPPLKISAKTKNNEALATSQALASDYRQALELEKNGKLKQSCDFFLKLSENQAFALKEAALVHTLSTCDYSNRELKKLWKKSEIPPFLKEAYVKKSYELAGARELKIFEARFGFELSEFTSIPAEKIKLITSAMEIAKKEDEDEDYRLFQKKLFELSPSYNQTIDEENIYKVAKDFESRRQFTKARELYQQIIDGKFNLAEKVKAFNALRMSFKVERNLKTFLTKTYDMSDFLTRELEANKSDNKTQEAWAESQITLARAVWTNHQSEQAKKILDKLISSELGSTNQKALALNVYASLFLEGKQYKEALKLLDQASALSISDQNLMENIQWASVWNYYLLKKYSVVTTLADKFIQKSNNQNFIAKLKFWKAKCLIKNRHTKDALALFTELMNADQFGFYGIMSAAELGASLPPLSVGNVEKPSSGNLILDWLMAVDESAWAQKQLKEINGQFKSYSQREKAMPLYAYTGWYQGGMRQIYLFKASERSDLTAKYINVIFPTAYEPMVNKSSKQFKIPSELIWAIIRQESAFVANERSWADAFGLMQLIPEKAKEFSSKYKIAYKDFNSLYLPETNIDMGSALLSELKKKYKGKFAQTVAAYNASEEAIATWEKERFHGDYLEFIEMIPYEETRNYIKLVFRNFITYKRITSKKPVKVSKQFFAQPFN